MGKRKRTLENINAEVDYLIKLLITKHLRKGEEGLRERLRIIEKDMLEKGGMYIKVNNDSTVTHAMKNGTVICGAKPKSGYMRVGIKPTCKRCLRSLEME